MRLRPHKPARQNVARWLPRTAEKFFAAGDKALENAQKAGQAHAFRILAKRFRYSLEYFRPCYGAGMDSYISQVRDLQQRLGALSDCVSSRELCQRLLKIGHSSRHGGLIEALVSREQQLLGTLRGTWRAPFRNPSFRQKLIRYLAHPPQAPKAQRKKRRKRVLQKPGPVPVEAAPEAAA